MSDLMMPPGHYLARGVSAILAETKAGQPQAAANIQIIEDGPWAGTQMPWFGPLGDHVEEKTKMRTIESLRNLGWVGDDLAENPLPGIGTLDVSVEVKHEEYQGVVKAKIAWVNKPGAMFAKPLEVNKAKAFAAQMRGLVAKVKAAASGSTGAPAAARAPASRAPAPPPQARQPQAAQAAMGVKDEEIPF